MGLHLEVETICVGIEARLDDGSIDLKVSFLECQSAVFPRTCFDVIHGRETENGKLFLCA